MSEDWVIRDAVPEDEACLVSFWLKSFAHAAEVRETGLEKANVDGSDDEIRYWRVHRPIVLGLLGISTVRVACAVGRVHPEPGRPAVIHAWSCTSPGYVHWVSVKRAVAKIDGGDLAREIVADLLGTHADEERRMTFDLLDLRKLGPLPELWKRDRSWLNALRSLSTRCLDGGGPFREVAQRVLVAEPWQISSERAA